MYSSARFVASFCPVIITVINLKRINRISSNTYVSQDGFTHEVAKEIGKTDWLALYFFLMDDLDVLVQPRRCQHPDPVVLHVLPQLFHHFLWMDIWKFRMRIQRGEVPKVCKRFTMCRGTLRKKTAKKKLILARRAELLS